MTLIEHIIDTVLLITILLLTFFIAIIVHNYFYEEPPVNPTPVFLLGSFDDALAKADPTTSIPMILVEGYVVPREVSVPNTSHGKLNRFSPEGLSSTILTRLKDMPAGSRILLKSNKNNNGDIPVSMFARLGTGYMCGTILTNTGDDTSNIPMLAGTLSVFGESNVSGMKWCIEKNLVGVK